MTKHNEITCAACEAAIAELTSGTALRGEYAAHAAQCDQCRALAEFTMVLLNTPEPVPAAIPSLHGIRREHQLRRQIVWLRRLVPLAAAAMLLLGFGPFLLRQWTQENPPAASSAGFSTAAINADAEWLLNRDETVAPESCWTAESFAAPELNWDGAEESWNNRLAQLSPVAAESKWRIECETNHLLNYEKEWF